MTRDAYELVMSHMTGDDAPDGHVYTICHTHE